MATATTKPRRLTLAKLGKYTSASIVGVIAGQSTLFVCSALLDYDPQISNLAAATVGAIPNYLVNRYWTWNKRGRNHFRREVLPFWLLSIAGLLVSTWFVGLADDRWDSQIAYQLANLAGYATLWVIKFLVLEHYLFKTEHEHLVVHHEPDEDGDLHHHLGPPANL